MKPLEYHFNQSITTNSIDDISVLFDLMILHLYNNHYYTMVFRIESLVRKGYNYYTRGCAYEYVSNKYIFVRKEFDLVLSRSERF